MKRYITIMSLFVCSCAVAMEQPIDPLALVLNNSNYRTSEISPHQQNPFPIDYQKTIINNSTNKIINHSSIKNKTVLVYNHPDCRPLKNSKLIVIIKDPINKNIDAPISILPYILKRTYSTDKKINTPEEIIIYKALEREALGHMADQTKLHEVLADKRLTPFAIAQFTQTALREYNNLLSAEALEFYTEKITNLIIAISNNSKL